ncbi:MAG: DNA repair protein RecO [bacterium]|nr:DNA repair protein RecO [bacterium]
MTESFIEALVLDRREAGEYDTLVDLYTREKGKITARAKSARKITSKLSPYLEPLNLIQARVLGGGENAGGRASFQIVDALGVERFPLTPQNLRLAALVNQLTFDLDPDPRLFHVLRESFIQQAHDGTAARYQSVLAVLGYDPTHAECGVCGKAPELFSPIDMAFYCGACATGFQALAFQGEENGLLSIL